MLRRKSTVQKSIRFDEKLASDLEILATELERTQNDLVNIAVENLMQENKGYFYKFIIADNLINLFHNDENDSFTIQNLTVSVVTTEKEYNLHTVVTDDGGSIIEERDETYQDIDGLQYALEQLALRYVEYDSEEVKKYLKNRLDYK